MFLRGGEKHLKRTSYPVLQRIQRSQLIINFLTFCQPHIDTSGQSNSVISKRTLQNLSYESRANVIVRNHSCIFCFASCHIIICLTNTAMDTPAPILPIFSDHQKTSNSNEGDNDLARGLTYLGEQGQLSGYSIVLVIKRSQDWVPAGAAGEFSSPGQLSVLTLISVSIPPPCYHSSM